MAKKSLSRVEAEKQEGMPTVNNDVPETMVQGDQQIARSDDAQTVKPVTSSFSPKRTTGKGARLKQETIAEAVTGASSTSGMGINAAGRGVSGTVGGVLGAANSTAGADQSRGKTRVGKKLDRIATKINYTPCEAVIIEVDEAKPLADAADKDQGYNGTYRNEFARSQKVMGAVPADLMFQRSVDLILKDKLYFVEGQQVFQMSGNRTIVNPHFSYNLLTKDYDEVEFKSGNYIHRAAHFGLNADGHVKYCFFDVDDITPALVSPDDANGASAHRLIKENTAEIDRMSMDSKAGDEKADLWTPLARAIKEPTNAAYFISSIEADTGAFVYLAYSKATTNFSYQLNRAAKDGLDIVTPAIEQLVGWRAYDSSNTDINSAYHNDLQECFDTDCYRAGDPSIMIHAYDSVAKYNNKADLLLQPRGFRMHLQTADNNMNPLHMPAELAQVYAGQECFSTIDHEYDPTLPICMTDKANLVTVHNFNELCAFIPHHYQTVLTATNIESDYDYQTEIIVPKGAVSALGYENLYVYGKATNSDGFVYSTGVISLDPDTRNGARTLDLLVMNRALTNEETGTGGDYEGYALLVTVPYSTTIDIVYHKPVVQNHAGDTVITAAATAYDGEVRYYKAGAYTYMYSDLRNYYYVEVKHPLVEGLIQYLNESIGGKIRSLIKREDFFVPFIFSTQYMTLAQLMICAATPWITRVRVNSMKDVIYYEENLGVYPFSKLAKLKDIPFKNYVNFGYSDYDAPLETKVMNPTVAIQWVMPEFFWKVDTERYVLPWYFNENELASYNAVDDDAACMSFPSVRSGVRLSLLDTLYGMDEKDVRLSLDRMTKSFLRSSKIASFAAYKYGRTTDGQILALLNSAAVITVGDILSCPRELGLCMDAPLGVLTLDPANSGAYTTMAQDGTASSFRIKVWVNPETKQHPTILDSNGVNIHRAANYTQKWFELSANNAVANTDLVGLVFGLGDEGAAEFSPFANVGDGSAHVSAPTVISHQRSLWTRIQCLPFVISPFDGHFTSGVSYSRDVYDFAYMFGLAGFRASDYRESVYNREKEVVNQGMLFVNDPWVESSPIVRNGATSTGVSITKGYELKVQQFRSFIK